MAKYFVKRPIEVLLFGLVLAMLVFVGSLVNSFNTLHKHMPLENFTGRIIDPVILGEQASMRTGGTFDRNISCNLISFQVILTNIDTDDVAVITEKHLLVAPPAQSRKGVNLNVQFETRIPKNLYAGTWSPVFQGTYICREGIFSTVKTQRALVPTFEVIDRR